MVNKIQENNILILPDGKEIDIFGKHVIFTGERDSGKTRTLLQLCESCSNNKLSSNLNYYSINNTFRLNDVIKDFNKNLSLYEKGKTTLFIDDIDAYLHPSLHQEVLPDLIDKFPNVQLFITTHSPSVIQSVENTFVYDLTNSELLKNLYMCSSESILNGLFNVDPISKHLKKIMLEISDIINIDNNTLTANIDNKSKVDKSRLLTLMQRVEPYKDKLDSKSKILYSLGEEVLLK